MVRLYMLLFSVVLTQPLLALEIFQSTGQSKWTFFYSENKNWIVESVALDQNGWPKLESHEVFERLEQAQVHLGSEASLLTKARAG